MSPRELRSYVSQIYKLEERQTQQARREAGCSLDGFKRHKMAKVALGGDVAFTEYPFTLAAKFVENARLYAGSEELMTDPIASPLHATRAALAHLPPIQIHVGLSEVLVSENVLFATRLAAAGGVVEVHTYDQMWHVFTMYYEGCEHPRLQKLLFAYSSLNLTSAFLRQLASTKDHGQLPWKSNGIPYTLTHYEYPRGVDAAMEAYHTKDHEGVPVADVERGVNFF